MPTRPPTDGERRRQAQGRKSSDDEYRRRRMSDDAEARFQRMRSSSRWQRLRRMVLAAEPCCRACLARGRTTAATEVDHVQRLRDRPDLAFDQANLQALCTLCHAAKSGAERAGRTGA